MMQHFLFFALLIVASTLFALLEIQIEGKYGWAQKLPTWRIQSKYFKFILSHEITGYHIFMFSMILVLLHVGLILNGWTLRGELIIISFYLLMTMFEDFLWFIFNPHYGIEKFNPKYVKWHTKWFLNFPVDYWIYIPIGILTYVVAIMV
jgi:hypothetical protein